MNPDALFMIAAILELLEGARHVAVGARSEIPAAAALLARELSGDAMTVSLLGSRRASPFTDGSRELFDCAAQGRIDVFFLSGCQIDGQGNVNLLGLGAPGRLSRRFAGNFGAPFMAFAVPRLLLFTLRHDRRTLVQRVDFISAPGAGPEGAWRRGGPDALVTPRCVFRFRCGRFHLAALHPGHTVEEIRRETGFAFEVEAPLQTTPRLDRRARALLAGPVAETLAEIAPAFADRLRAAATA